MPGPGLRAGRHCCICSPSPPSKGDRLLAPFSARSKLGRTELRQPAQGSGSRVRVRPGLALGVASAFPLRGFPSPLLWLLPQPPLARPPAGTSRHLQLNPAPTASSWPPDRQSLGPRRRAVWFPVTHPEPGGRPSSLIPSDAVPRGPPRPGLLPAQPPSVYTSRGPAPSRGPPAFAPAPRGLAPTQPVCLSLTSLSKRGPRWGKSPHTSLAVYKYSRSQDFPTACDRFYTEVWGHPAGHTAGGTPSSFLCLLLRKTPHVSIVYRIRGKVTFLKVFPWLGPTQPFQPPLLNIL